MANSGVLASGLGKQATMGYNRGQLNSVAGTVFVAPPDRHMKGWSPLMLPHYTLTPETQQAHARFWSKVAISDGCWLWLAHTIRNGYGRFNAGARMVLAHRQAWEIAYGAIPEGLLVCHHCDVRYPVGDITYRRCVNPAHLFLGTKLDNARDMVAKGRQACGDRHSTHLYPEIAPRGERGGRAKLTTAQVIEIRSLHAAGNITQQALSERFGINSSTVAKIVHRQRWAHIAMPLWPDGEDNDGE